MLLRRVFTPTLTRVATRNEGRPLRVRRLKVMRRKTGRKGGEDRRLSNGTLNTTGGRVGFLRFMVCLQLGPTALRAKLGGAFIFYAEQ